MAKPNCPKDIRNPCLTSPSEKWWIFVMEIMAPASSQGNWYYCTETAKPPASMQFILQCGRHETALLVLQIAKNFLSSSHSLTTPAKDDDNQRHGNLRQYGSYCLPLSFSYQLIWQESVTPSPLTSSLSPIVVSAALREATKQLLPPICHYPPLPNHPQQ